MEQLQILQAFERPLILFLLSKKTRSVLASLERKPVKQSSQDGGACGYYGQSQYKYGEPKKLEKDEFLEWRKKIYLSYELSPNGIPSQDMLKRIGMEFVVSVLDKVE